jgi:hypothetical protein
MDDKSFALANAVFTLGFTARHGSPDVEMCNIFQAGPKKTRGCEEAAFPYSMTMVAIRW